MSTMSNEGTYQAPPSSLLRTYNPNTPTQVMGGINASKGPQVFLGYEEISLPPSLTRPGVSGKQRIPKYVPIDFAKTQARLLGQEGTQKLFQIIGQQYGDYATKTDAYMNSVWEGLVDLSSQIKTQYGQNVAPLDAYDWWLENTGRKPGGTAATGGGTTRARTRAREETINFTDPGTARTIVDQTLQSYLGRTATDKEFRAFSQALRSVEENMPVVVEQETMAAGTKADRTQRTRTVREGGMNAQSFADAWARGQEGSAEYTAATRLMDAFNEAIIGDTL